MSDERTIQERRVGSFAEAQSRSSGEPDTDRTGADVLRERESPTIEVPQRNLLEEGRQTLQLLQEAYPQLLELERLYGPDFARAEVATATARGFAELESAESAGTRFRDLIVNSSPEAGAASDVILREAAATGPSEIEQELNRQALEELRLGGQISADEQREVVQGVRGAFSQRGLATGGRAAVTEVLGRTQLAEARKDSRRAFAQGVDAQTVGRRTADQAFGLNALNTSARLFDPQARLFGGPTGSTVTGNVAAPNQFAQFLTLAGDVGRSNQTATLTGSLAQVEDIRARDLAAAEFQQDVFNTNLNAQFNRDIADRNASAANKSAAISAGGAIAGALLIAF